MQTFVSGAKESIMNRKNSTLIGKRTAGFGKRLKSDTWVVKRLTTTRSINLETKERLEMGRCELHVCGSIVGFLSGGERALA